MAKKFQIYDAIESSTISAKVGRSLVFTICDGHFIVQGGEYADFTDTLLGKWTAKRATEKLRRVHGDETIQIVHTEIYKQYVQMDLLDFWLEAEATSDPVKVTDTYLK